MARRPPAEAVGSSDKDKPGYMPYVKIAVMGKKLAEKCVPTPLRDELERARRILARPRPAVFQNRYGRGGSPGR